ncbi:MAG: NusG domain II-containing protein [Eubacteriales bacterium]
MKKQDLMLIGGLLAAALLIFLGVTLFKGHGEALLYAKIQVDGQEVARLPLSEDREYPVRLEDGEYNIVIVSDGKVFVSSASCPDGVCVRTGKADSVGDSIICLPHRLVITVEEEGS